MSSRKKRPQLDRLNAFDEKTDLEQVADEIFGASAPPELNTGRIVARPTPLTEIWADIRQPRRVVPASIRLVWNGSPADVPQLLDTWSAVAANAAGRTIDIQAIIQGDGDGAAADTDGTPAIYESFISLLRLAGSILREGLINPITIIDQRDRHIIESGERRWLAYWLLHLHTQAGDEFARIPAATVSGADFVWRQAAENTARRSLNAVGMARQLALLIMAARGADQYADYDMIVPPGGSDRRYYAQVADGNTHRIPKGAGERIQAAMALSMEQISRYRSILRLTDDDEINDLLWLRGDIEEWPESSFRNANTLPIGKVRDILSRDAWSLDDFRAAATPAKVQPPTPPLHAMERGTGGGDYAAAEAEEARRILDDIRQGFARVYAIEDSDDGGEQIAATRATRALSQAQVHYESNRLVTAKSFLDEAFRILDEAADPADAAPDEWQPPKPSTSAAPMHKIYGDWRARFRDGDIVLITSDGNIYFALHKDDGLLRRVMPMVSPGGIGLHGGADYMLVSKIDAALYAALREQYKGSVIGYSYADLDEKMRWVVGTAFRALEIPLNTLPPPHQQPPDGEFAVGDKVNTKLGRRGGEVIAVDGRMLQVRFHGSPPFHTTIENVIFIERPASPASDKSPSDRSPEIVERVGAIFHILTRLADLAVTTHQADAASAANTLLDMTWDDARQLAEAGNLDHTLGTASDHINAAFNAWSDSLAEFLADLYQQLNG